MLVLMCREIRQAIMVFTFNNVNISANATLQNGQSFLIRPDLRAIDNIQVVCFKYSANSNS